MEHPAYVSVPANSRAFARSLALLIELDCDAREARYLPEFVVFQRDIAGDVWPAPSETVARGAGDCFGLGRCAGAYKGTRVACVQTGPDTWHVWLEDDAGNVIDEARDRGMEPDPSVYTMTGIERVSINRPSVFNIARTGANGFLTWEILRQTTNGPQLGDPPLPPAARPVVSTVAMPPAAVLSVLQPLLTAAAEAGKMTAPQLASAQLVARWLTQIHANAAGKKSLQAALIDMLPQAQQMRISAGDTSDPTERAAAQQVQQAYQLAGYSLLIGANRSMLPEVIGKSDRLQLAALAMAQLIIRDLSSGGVNVTLTPGATTETKAAAPLEITTITPPPATMQILQPQQNGGMTLSAAPRIVYEPPADHAVLPGCPGSCDAY